MKETININGEEYCLVVNWNAVQDYCKRKGINNLIQIDSVLSFNIDGMLTMAHCCIKEGERLEGRILDISEEELGNIMTPVSMTEFAKCYVRQVTTGITDVGVAKKKRRALP